MITKLVAAVKNLLGQAQGALPAILTTNWKILALAVLIGILVGLFF